MGLTPDVAAGTLIQSSWGNEIRNRTVQVFATVTERNNWIAPPHGAIAVTTDTNTVWQRTATTWVKVNARGRTAVTTDGNGEATITHGLGTTPPVVLASPGSASVFLITENMTTTTFRVHATTAPGNNAANTSISVNWVCFP